MSSGGSSPHTVALLAPHMPYLLHYAWLLAQYGYIQQALQYCHWIIQLHGSKGAPQGLHLCRVLTEELQGRLHAYAHVWCGCGRVWEGT